MARSKNGNKRPVTRGDVITVDNRGDHNAIAAGRGAKAVISQAAPVQDLEIWRMEMEREIDTVRGLLPADKADLKENVAKIAEEASKGKETDRGRLERLLNMIGGMAPDIFEVALATLTNPLAGVGLVAKKIGDRAKVDAI